MWSHITQKDTKMETAKKLISRLPHKVVPGGGGSSTQRVELFSTNDVVGAQHKELSYLAQMMVI